MLQIDRMKFVTVFGVLLLAAFTHGCKDRRPDCKNMALYCKLKPYEDYMRTWCPRFCGLCDGPPTRRPPPTQAPPTDPLPTGTHPPLGACGKPSFAQSKVVAGKNARRGAWPWQILLQYNGRGMCGGTIISPRWVVTAAHCVSGKESHVTRFTVRVGEHDRNRNEGSEVNMRVSRIISHPGWSRRTMNNDIALIQLSSPITFNQYVQPACLPTGDAPVGTECYITGWGKIRHPGSMHNYLQQAILPVVANNVCERHNKKVIPIPITGAMICGGDAGRSRKSGCHGDSGGPYVCKIGDQYELHGAVSHGSPKCQSTETYTVFARVNYFKSWISGNMAKYGI